MLTQSQYEIERAICDKAHAYAKATMAGKRNYMTADECAHPDYAACNNAMRGRVEQFEILRDLPDTIVAYIGTKEPSRLSVDVGVWTGDKLGVAYQTSSWRVNSYVDNVMYAYRAKIGNREYVGRGFGQGMSIVLRAAKTKQLG